MSPSLLPHRTPGTARPTRLQRTPMAAVRARRDPTPRLRWMR